VQKTKFSAADAALGYAYQVRCALLYSLRRIKGIDPFEVSIETLDDVAFTSAEGDPLELLQLKHSLKSISKLGDSGSDLWKTIRAWIESDRVAPFRKGTRLYLISTAVASRESAAARLRCDGRDLSAAVAALDLTATTSESRENAEAYAAWRALTVDRRLDLLDRIEVIDGSPLITDLDTELQREVFGFAARQHRDAFIEYLEGWWFRRVIRQLAGTAPPIASEELESQLDDLRERFQRQNLPIDEDLLLMELDKALVDSYKTQVFVRQLELVAASAQRIGIAIRDYFRAYQQRSRWIRRDLVLEVELKGYEQRLIDEWTLIREQLLDEIGPDAADEVLNKTGRKLLKWAEDTLFAIRPSVDTPFISRGSFHILADDRRVGWHPRFQERLSALLAAGNGVGT
jgi:hypothetical protein